MNVTVQFVSRDLGALIVTVDGVRLNGVVAQELIEGDDHMCRHFVLSKQHGNSMDVIKVLKSYGFSVRIDGDKDDL